MVTILIKWLLLVMESTITMIASFPFDSGSSTMNSTLIISHGVSGIGRGCSSPEGGWQIDFTRPTPKFSIFRGVLPILSCDKESRDQVQEHRSCLCSTVDHFP